MTTRRGAGADNGLTPRHHQAIRFASKLRMLLLIEKAGLRGEVWLLYDKHNGGNGAVVAYYWPGGGNVRIGQEQTHARNDKAAIKLACRAAWRIRRERRQRSD